MSVWQRGRSVSNGFWLKIRSLLRYSRRGYSEATRVTPVFSPASQEINDRYQFSDIGKRLAPRHWHRNLATLWYMEQMLDGLRWTKPMRVLEPGTQDFSRLPAFRSYFKKHAPESTFIGIELDAYVPLRDFYSLWDHAQYYISLDSGKAEIIATDFFQYQDCADLILCFYPFVSCEPALAWGIPAEYASARKWVESFVRNLKSNGYVLVIHQGEWEEKDFDGARKGTSLELMRRRQLECPFFSMKFPVRASLYKKSGGNESRVLLGSAT